MIGRSVCMSVGHVRETCENGRTDRNAVWKATHLGPRNHVLDGRIHSPPQGVTGWQCGLLQNSLTLAAVAVAAVTA